MEQLIFRPRLHSFDTPEAFADAFELGENDLVLTLRSVFEGRFDLKKHPVQTIFLGDYGKGEPTDRVVNEVIRETAKHRYRRIIGIGGGSVLDTAKVLAVSGGRDTDTLYDSGEPLSRTVSLVLVPTTCGTGSEVTNIAIMTREKLGTKMGLTGEATYADDAVLIPTLLKSIPFSVFATSSIDALVHAVESALSPNATPFSRTLSYEAMTQILSSYRLLLKKGKEHLPEWTDRFLFASTLAGLAFGTAGCAAVHAMSYPLSGVYHVAHGESNYAMFTGVLKMYQKIKSDGEIAELNNRLAVLLDCRTDAVYDELEALLNQLLPKKALHEYGVKEEELPLFAENVIQTQQRLMKNSFVPLDSEKVLEIYRSLY